MNKLARVALVVTLLAASFPLAQSVATPTLSNQAGEDWLNGAAGYARAVELHQKLNVPLVVYFYAFRCPNCRTLDNQYLTAEPVQDYLRGVVKVRINPEHGMADWALAKRYGVNDYPSFFVMRNSAAQPVNIQPFRQVGNLTPTQFAEACNATAPVSRKGSAVVRTPGTSGKFRVRPDEVTGGAQIVTATPTTPALRKAGGRKQ